MRLQYVAPVALLLHSEHTCHMGASPNKIAALGVHKSEMQDFQALCYCFLVWLGAQAEALVYLASLDG